MLEKFTHMATIQRTCKLFLMLIVFAGILMIGLYTFSSASFTQKHKEHAWIKSRYGRQNNMAGAADKLMLTNTSLVTETDNQRERFQQLHRQCREFDRDGSDFMQINISLLDHLIVNDLYKVLYCYVPKVACTNLKRIFLLLSGKMNETDPLKLKSQDVHGEYDQYLKYLNTFSAPGIKYRLENYKKIIFVREPFERMLSAYRNKFAQRGNSYFKERFGRKIIKKYRKNPSESSLATGDDMEFPEFVSYLVDPETAKSKRGFNEHWAPFYNLCHPCHIKYDFIGKYETLDDDVDAMLQELAVDDVIQFPKRSDMYKTKKTGDFLLKYYQKIGQGPLKKIKKIYSKDSKIFGYTFPESLEDLLSY